MAGGRDSKGKLLETPVQSIILDHLTREGVFCWRSQPTPVPIRRGRIISGLRAVPHQLKGMPDIMCIYKGNFVGIEVKRESGGKQTPEQLSWQKRVLSEGGYYTLASSWKEVQIFFYMQFGAHFQV